MVAAQGGGAAEIIESGVDGLFHSPGNELELRAALQMLLDDASLRDSFAYAGLLKVEKQYRPSHMMRVVEGVYDQLLATAATSQSADRRAMAHSA